MTVPDRPSPGFRVWEWERGLLGAFAGTLAAFAGAVLTVAFTLSRTAKVVAFVVAGVLAVVIFALLFVSANRKPVPPDDGSVNPGSDFVDDKSKVIGTDLESVGQEPIPPPPGPT
jgi:hypothetical protein